MNKNMLGDYRIYKRFSLWMKPMYKWLQQIRCTIVKSPGINVSYSLSGSTLSDSFTQLGGYLGLYWVLCLERD